MDRQTFYVSTACYLRDENNILFIKFNKKWGQVYAPPGGKVEKNETPLECIKREFLEETNLKLIDVKFKGILQWIGGKNDYGIIFIYISNKYEGNIIEDVEEGKLEWIDINNISSIKQFPINSKISNELLLDDNAIFEGKFNFDEDDNLVEYNINIM